MGWDMATGGETRTVELFQAFLWTCDDCGRDNFERGITVAPESISREDLPVGVGIDTEAIQEWMENGCHGDWVTNPSKVRCSHCGSEFEAAPA
jgi:hypothetical protein